MTDNEYLAQWDGYHTFRELYDHRAALFVALANAHPNYSWRSLVHEDSSMFEGFFVAGMWLESGMISYHLEQKYWPYLEEICTLEKAPHWDGHTPEEVVRRLLAENRPRISLENHGT